MALPSSSLRFTARVQDIASGETIAAASASGREDELFDLARRAGADLRLHLGLDTVGDAQPAHAPAPISIEATRLYGSGVDALQRYELTEACALLLSAEKADPEFAQTHRALADVWTRLGYEPRAAAEARLASERMKNLPRGEQPQIEAMLAQASHDWPKLIDIRQSLWRFYPDNLDLGLDLASALALGGRSNDGLAVIQQIRSSPEMRDDPRVDFGEASLRAGTGEYKLALAPARRTAARARRIGARVLLARARGLEGFALLRLGDAGWRAAVDESIALSRTSRFRIGEARALFTLALGLSENGQREEALRVVGAAEHIALQLGDVRLRYGAPSTAQHPG